ncbi:hypothetical protein MD484_g7704, partial [Candolleomyces efflorescens]
MNEGGDDGGNGSRETTPTAPAPAANASGPSVPLTYPHTPQAIASPAYQGHYVPLQGYNVLPPGWNVAQGWNIPRGYNVSTQGYNAPPAQGAQAYDGQETSYQRSASGHHPSQPQHGQPVYVAHQLPQNAPQSSMYPYHPGPQFSPAPVATMPPASPFAPPGHQYQSAVVPSTSAQPQPSGSRSTVGSTSDAESGATTETESATTNATTRKKRRLVGGDNADVKGKKPEQSYNNHPIPDPVLLQNLQTQFIQITERLDNISSNMRVLESQPQSLPVSVDVMQQLLQGFKENTEILREGFRLQGAQNGPNGESGGGNENMDVDPSISASSLSKIEIKMAPVTRTDESKSVARIVRDFFKSLLKGHIGTNNDWQPTAETPACTIEDFRLDFEKPPNAPWNKSAKKTFLEALMAREANRLAAYQPPPEYLARLYVSNFRNARAKFKWELKAKAEQDAHRELHRRNERKRWLYYRRIQAAKRFNDTKRHLPMIAAYGWEGMSTDESDHDNGTGGPSYCIRPKKWRHPNADQCLRTLDSLHWDSRFRQDRCVTPGAHPHQRNLCGRSEPSTRGAIRKLPTGLYNPNWVSRLTDAAKQDLGITETIEYDFSHTAEIEDISRINNGKVDSIYPFA